MEDCEISLKSTCEEVANFFVKKFKIDTKLKDCLIKEGISGDMLLDLVKYKNYFGFKPGTWNQIKKFLERNKDLFKSKIVYENISIKDYMYASKPVTICSRLWCDVLLTQQEEDHETVTCPLLKPRWKNKIIRIPHHWVDDGLAPFNGTLSLIISLVNKLIFSLLGSDMICL